MIKKQNVFTRIATIRIGSEKFEIFKGINSRCSYPDEFWCIKHRYFDLSKPITGATLLKFGSFFPKIDDVIYGIIEEAILDKGRDALDRDNPRASKKVKQMRWINFLDANYSQIKNEAMKVFQASFDGNHSTISEDARLEEIKRKSSKIVISLN